MTRWRRVPRPTCFRRLESFQKQVGQWTGLDKMAQGVLIEICDELTKWQCGWLLWTTTRWQDGARWGFVMSTKVNMASSRACRFAIFFRCASQISRYFALNLEYALFRVHKILIWPLKVSLKFDSNFEERAHCELNFGLSWQFDWQSIPAPTIPVALSTYMMSIVYYKHWWPQPRGAQLGDGTKLRPWPLPHQILKNTKTTTTTMTTTLPPHWLQLVHCAGEAGDPDGWAWSRRTTPPTCSSWIEAFNCIDHDTFVDFNLSWGVLACALWD